MCLAFPLASYLVVVSLCGIEANPDKIKAIEQIQAPETFKDVSRLTGCVAALSRFISKSAERALPFFKILKKARPMKWAREANATLQDLKTYFSSVPTLVAPNPQESLLLYLAATNQVVSTALVAQREVEKTKASTDVPPRAGRENTPARSDVDQDKEKHDSKGNPKDTSRKKVVQHPEYFISSLLHGVGPGILVCKNCFSALSWPQGNCATTSKPRRSPLSPAFLCNGYSETLRLSVG